MCAKLLGSMYLLWQMSRYALTVLLQPAGDVRDRRADAATGVVGTMNADADPTNSTIANTTKFMEKFIFV